MLGLARTTREMQFGPPSGTPQLITKLGGQPWWPKGVPRPECRSGHRMSFVLQIALSDVPSLDQSGLLSFHYCQECAADGNMSFGYGDTNTGYHLRVFGFTELTATDDVGIVAESIVPDHSVVFRNVTEVPTCEDAGIAWEATPEDYPVGESDLDANIYPGLVHVSRSKIAGWPSWVQSPEWPDNDRGTWAFLAQLDWEIGGSAPWAGGGYAYLFLRDATSAAPVAELVLQTT